MPVPFVPFADCVEAALNFSWRTIPAVNTLMFKKDEGGVTQNDLIDLGLLLRNWYQSFYQDAQTPDITLNSIKLTDLTTQTSPTFTYTAALPVSGLTAGDSVINHSAMCLSFGTAARGRSARGRNYLAGLDKAQVIENFWTQAYTNILVAGYDDLLAFGGEHGWIWGVGSRKLNGEWRTSGLFRQVTSVTAKSLKVATMRERMNG